MVRSFWDVTPCNLVETGRNFRKLTASIFETSVNLYEPTRCNISEGNFTYLQVTSYYITFLPDINSCSLLRLHIISSVLFLNFCFLRFACYNAIFVFCCFTIFLQAEINNFSSSLCVQTRYEAHPVSYPMGTGGPFPGVKRGRSVTLIISPF
jgi:hypothetical protein